MLQICSHKCITASPLLVQDTGSRSRLALTAAGMTGLLMMDLQHLSLWSSYRSTAGSHVIFYRLTQGGIDIVRILHGSVDFEQHL